MINQNECVACDTGGKCPTGEKRAARYCPRCKEKLNQHTPKICPGCKLDLMAWLWEEIDRSQDELTDSKLHQRGMVEAVLLQEAEREIERLTPLAVAVGNVAMNDVPESVWRAWQEPDGYRQDELVRLRDREAELESQVARLTRQLADKTAGKHLQGWGTVVKTDPEKWMIMVSSEPCLTDAYDQIKEKVTGFIDPEPFKRVAVCPTAYFDGIEPLGWETCDRAPREKGTPCSTQNK